MECKMQLQKNQFHSIGNGWLFRSAIAKIRKLLYIYQRTGKRVQTRESMTFRFKALSGRYVVITFANEATRDNNKRKMGDKLAQRNQTLEW